jgi:hypothetical protein
MGVWPVNTTRPVHKPGITVKDIGGEEEAIHILNPTAHLIWELWGAYRRRIWSERLVPTSL